MAWMKCARNGIHYIYNVLCACELVWLFFLNKKVGTIQNKKLRPQNANDESCS